MRALVQRVSEASVRVNEKIVAEVGAGLLVLLGIKETDTDKDADFVAEKIVNLRIFDDEAGKLNCSGLDVGAEILVVSQFTLYGDCSKGRRPSYSTAMDPVKAKELYTVFLDYLNAYGLRIESGVFQKMMKVGLVNDGPVTLLIESKEK